MTSSLATVPSSSSFLSEPQLQQLSAAIQGLNTQQLTWASGYLAGLSQAAPATQTSTAPTLTILYASHTGNGKALANNLAQQAQANGLLPRVLSCADYKPRELAKESLLLLIISTHGEGEPPETALELHRYLFGKRAPKLDQLQFAVFALGDSSYEKFCQAGRDVDARLQQLGASPLLARVDADVEFKSQAQTWTSEVIEKAAALSPTQNASAATNVVALNSLPATPQYNKDNPYPATLLEARRITSDDAVRDVHHLELQIDPTALPYQAGDALGVWVHNDPALVERILQAAELEADSTVSLNDETLTLQQALIQKRELTQLHPSMLRSWTQLSKSVAMQTLVADSVALNHFIQQHQVIDLLLDYPLPLQAQQLVDLLQPLQPRLYSIASSQQQAEDEVHLTVSLLQYQRYGHTYQGAASSFLTQRLTEDDQVDVYVVENELFRLPEDNNTPIIMIGGGTGIAPFRAFLQQRDTQGAKGKNWLIFGNRHFHRDFLYQLDWQDYRKRGLLDRISLAFSRDEFNGAYIQQRMIEAGAELYTWLEQGAHLYVCGSQQIDHAVHNALVVIIEQYQPANSPAAQEYIDNLRNHRRYLRDVY